MPGAVGNEAILDPTAPWSAATPLTVLTGVGPVVAARLAGAGLRTVGDLLRFFPRRYAGLQELPAPHEAAVGTLVRLRGRVERVAMAWLPGRRSMVTVGFAAGDGTPFDVAFFNQPWLRKSWPPGTERTVEGELQRKGRRFVLAQARVFDPAATRPGAVQLRYGEIEGVGAARLLGFLDQALARLDWSSLVLPPLPPGLDELAATPRELFFAMHRPADLAAHERARRHFAVREAVALFAAVERARRQRTGRIAEPFTLDARLAGAIAARMPFAFTDEQERATTAIVDRLRGPAPMGVLLQGEVGSGKTAVAMWAALLVLARGGQVAFLAPTELLAQQQAATVAHWLRGSDVEVVLLTAALAGKARDEVLTRLRAGGRHLVFGTHALLGEQVGFARLALVVIDEQHRFGVDQRMALVHKGKDPHVLVMTATPIPRTLALTLFGDLDVIVLRSRPPGRRPVPARFLPGPRWPRAVAAIARAVRRGGRVFVVCPAVGEDGEKGGVVRMQQALATRFRTALVHGRLPMPERERALAAFVAGECDVLIGTTVLEVGIDVPAATLMVVAGAERFGIAQLHQLRGRVGRGRRRGLCILCGADGPRIQAVCRSTDGFALAEADLGIRGSGELLGTAQSGAGELRALDPVDDLQLLLRVRAAVREA